RVTPEAVEGTGVVSSDNFGGGSLCMKWKYTKGPPTTITSATTAAPTSRRTHLRGWRVEATCGSLGRGSSGPSIAGRTVRALCRGRPRTRRGREAMTGCCEKGCARRATARTCDRRGLEQGRVNHGEVPLQSVVESRRNRRSP